MIKTKVIAEVGVNHNGDYGIAEELIHVAAEAGCDYVKFQTFDPKKLVMTDVQTVGYQQNNTGESSQKKMLNALAMPLEWHERLSSLANSLGIKFASTGFDTASVSFLANLGVPFLKIPSGEITNARLLLHVARLHVPIILSTGMADLNEIADAMAIILWGITNDHNPKNIGEVRHQWQNRTAEDAGRLENLVTILQCTSLYPTPPDLANLRCLETLKTEFGTPVGLSDHTAGIMAPIVAVALGATIIEKHITIDRSLPGPDHLASIEPPELIQMVANIHEVHSLMGDGQKKPCSAELDQRNQVRQSLVAARSIKKNAVLVADDITTTRAKNGRSAIFVWDLEGQSVNQDVSKGEAL